MNIYEQFMYRNSQGEWPSEMILIVSSFNSPEEYDAYLNKEINKISQTEFLKGLEKEINNKAEIYKASFIKGFVFDTYVTSYVKKVKSIEAKEKFIELADYVLKNYKDSDKLALGSVKNFKKDFLDGMD